MACFTALLAALLMLIGFSNAQTFVLQHNYTGTDFFNNGFNVYAGFDPTYGFVEYVDLPTAQQHGLVDLDSVTTNGKARWGVETQSTLDPNGNLGRKSLRLQSAATYTHGLSVLDVAHVPATTCGTWPAFWLVGVDKWPTSGEIDILENINNAPGNLMSLHSTSTPNCTVAGTGQTGTLLTNDCAYANSYTGCAVATHDPIMSGTGLNSVSGGVYAMLWTSEGIQMWTFPRSALPASLSDTTKVPNLSEFGVPVANFQGSCDFDAHFHDQQIVFNTDFCGSNAGPNFAVNGCPVVAGKNPWESCNIFVANNPQAFTESYWEVNALKVYQVVAGPPSIPPTSVLESSSIPVASTSSISTLSSAANGRPTTPSSPVVLPTTTVVQGRDLTSVAGATWPTWWTVPAPFPTEILPRNTQSDNVVCDFQLPGGILEETHETDFACTFSKTLTDAGGEYTSTVVKTTSMLSSAPLHITATFDGFISTATYASVEIDSISWDCSHTRHMPEAAINQAAFTGSFTAPPTHITSTQLAAWPEHLLDAALDGSHADAENGPALQHPDAVIDPHARPTHTRPSIPLCPRDNAEPAIVPSPQTAHTEHTATCLKTGWAVEAIATPEAGSVTENLDVGPDPQARRTHTRPTIPLCPRDDTDPSIHPDPQTAHTERTAACLKTGWPVEAMATAEPYTAHTERTGRSLILPTRTRPHHPPTPQVTDREGDDAKLIFDRDAESSTRSRHEGHIESSALSLMMPTWTVSTGHVVIPDVTTHETTSTITPEKSSSSSSRSTTISPTSVSWTGDANPVITITPAAAQHGGGATIRHGGHNSSYVAAAVVLVGVAAGAFLL